MRVLKKFEIIYSDQNRPQAKESDMEKVGVEVLKEVLKEVDAVIELGIEIGKGGLGKEDIVHVPAVIERVKAMIKLAGKAEQAKAELGDIDAAEVGELLAAAWSELQDKG
jgi:pentose-5-phosphate-3-epimerase